jgi:hypothetical protein
MAIEYLSQEELHTYYENPHLFIIRANQMRSKMICDFLLRLKNRMTSLLK